MDGVIITDLTSLNTNKESMGLTVDMFLDHAVQEKALGKLAAAENKEKRRQAGMLREYGGARLSAGLVAIMRCWQKEPHPKQANGTIMTSRSRFSGSSAMAIKPCPRTRKACCFAIVKHTSVMCTMGGLTHMRIWLPRSLMVSNLLILPPLPLPNLTPTRLL
jgi:hypothetical protein